MIVWVDVFVWLGVCETEEASALRMLADRKCTERRRRRNVATSEMQPVRHELHAVSMLHKMKQMKANLKERVVVVVCDRV